MPMKNRNKQDFPELAPGIGKILFSEKDIEHRIHILGKSISADYKDKNPLLIGVLNGVFMFMADLQRAISISCEVAFMGIASYSAETRDRGVVRIVKDLELPITGRHVLFIEDVIDTGLTINFLHRSLRTQEPASLETCALFDKSHRRLIKVPIRYKGFDLPDRFVIGYGLDYRGKYRNLPFVALLESRELPERN